MNSSQFNKILVVKHGSLGDIAFSILAMASIKQFFNNATIDLLTEEKYVNFLSNSNYFNSIFKDNRKGIIDSLKVILKINFHSNQTRSIGGSITKNLLVIFIK